MDGKELTLEEKARHYKHNINLLGQIFKEDRIKHNVSVTKIANLAKVDKSTIYRFEKGVRATNMDIVFKICKALKQIVINNIEK